jgi:hypothetical protein
MDPDSGGLGPDRRCLARCQWIRRALALGSSTSSSEGWRAPALDLQPIANKMFVTINLMKIKPKRGPTLHHRKELLLLGRLSPWVDLDEG